MRLPKWLDGLLVGLFALVLFATGGVFLLLWPPGSSEFTAVFTRLESGVEFRLMQRKVGWMDGYATRLCVTTAGSDADEYFLDYDSPHLWWGSIDSKGSNVLVFGNGFRIASLAPDARTVELPSGREVRPFRSGSCGREP